MSTHGTVYPQLWDKTLAVGPALMKFIPKLVDFTINFGRPSSIDEFGLAYCVLSPAAFHVRFHAHPQRRPDMAPAAGTNVDLANWKVRNDKKEDQLGREHFVRNTVLFNVPEEYQRPMQDEDGSMHARSTEYVITTLLATHGTLTTADIDRIMAQLSVKYVTGSPLTSFIADWQIHLRDLRRANQPLSQHQAISVLQQCFGSEFDDCWVKFVQDNPVPADRTVILLGAAIIAFDKDVLPIRAAQRAIGISQVVNQTAMLTQLQDEIAELRQALAEQVRPAPRKRGGGGAICWNCWTTSACKTAESRCTYCTTFLLLDSWPLQHTQGRCLQEPGPGS